MAELARIRGLGDAKAVRVKAALELGRRLAARSPEERPPVGSPEDVANLLGTEMAALEQEQLQVVLLDTKHRILGTRTVYQGSVNQKQVSTGDQTIEAHPTATTAKIDVAARQGRLRHRDRALPLTAPRPMRWQWRTTQDRRPRLSPACRRARSDAHRAAAAPGPACAPPRSAAHEADSGIMQPQSLR